MSAHKGVGVAGSISDPENLQYPGVPYSRNDFHKDCEILSYVDGYQVRNCRLVGLPDLNHKSSYVIEKIVAYLNHLIDLGVSGFRVDAGEIRIFVKILPFFIKILFFSQTHVSRRFSCHFE